MEREQGSWKEEKGMEGEMILSNEICLTLILVQNKLFLGGKEAEEAVIKNVLVQLE